MDMSKRCLVPAATAVILVALSLAVWTVGPDMLKCATLVASPLFSSGYSVILVGITLVIVVRSYERINAERDVAQAIIIAIGDPQRSPLGKLITVNHMTDARLVTLGRSHHRPPENRTIRKDRTTGIAHSVAAFLGLLTAVPASRHSIEGLRPAERFLVTEIHRHLPRAADKSDVLIRLSLLGTFIGLIAALTIAGANAGNTAADNTGQLKVFVQQLLGTAGAKFWISGVGMACALSLHAWQSFLDRSMSKIIGELGYMFDLALVDETIAQAWCSEQTTIAPDRDQSVPPATKAAGPFQSRQRSPSYA